MTVAALARTVEYAGDGATTAFAIPFQFLTGGVSLWLRDAAGAEVSVAATISGGHGGTGMATLAAAPLAGVTVVIRGTTPIEQPTQYPQGGDFPARSHERALDRAAMIAQESRDRIDDTRARAPMVPAGVTAPAMADPAGQDGRALVMVDGRIGFAAITEAAVAQDVLRAEAAAAVSTDASAIALAAAERTEEDRAAVEARAATGVARAFGLWADLSAATGAVANEGAVVFGPDAGTHTDAVSGTTVANTGVFAWTGAAWTRLSDLPSAVASDPALPIAAARQTALVLNRQALVLERARALVENKLTMTLPPIAIPQPKIAQFGRPADFAWRAGQSLWWAGAQYPDEASFLNAIRGVQDSISLVMGNVPVYPPLIVKPIDPTFAGWAVFGGATKAVVGGRLQITHAGNGQRSGASLRINSGVARKALRVTYKMQRVTVGVGLPNLTPAWSNVSASFTNNFVTGGDLDPDTIAVEQVISAKQGDVYFGAFTDSAQAGQVHEIWDVQVEEVVPFPGFTAGGYGLVVEGTTPAAGTGLRTLYSFDIGHTHDYAEVNWNAATEEVRFMAAYNGSSGAIDHLLGTVPPNTVMRVGHITAQRTSASLNGSDPNDTSTTAVNFGAAAYLRLGRSLTAGREWGSRPRVVDAFAPNMNELTLRHHTAPDNAVWAAGDSYMASASGGGDPWWKSLQTALGRKVLSQAVGGTLGTTQLDEYFLENLAAQSRMFVFYDGGWSGDDTAMTVDAALENLRRLMRIKTDGKFLVLAPVVPPMAFIGGQWQVVTGSEAAQAGAPFQTQVDEYITKAKALVDTADPYGDGKTRFDDSRTYFDSLSDGSPAAEADKVAGYRPRNLFLPNRDVHLLGSVRVAHANRTAPMVSAVG